jgi:electron transfer flavoprotein alpha subunit
MKTGGEVWVYIQRQGNDIAEASLEIFSKALDLAGALAVPVAAVIMGEDTRQAAETMSRYGAHRVYLLQSPQLGQYTTILYARAITRLAQQYRPDIFLLAATPQGRDLAPRLASALGVGLTADCTELKIGTYTDPKTKQKHAGLLLQIRPAWGGNLIATIVNPDTRPQMATVREGVMRLPQLKAAHAAEILEVCPELDGGGPDARIIDRRVVGRKVNLKQAKIIVAGGAGAGTREHFQLIHQLAHVLGGEVGASRAAVDAGFIDHDHQVGQTGTSVRPKLYIACGISGTVQHLAGMEESGKILAINTDPAAPIFSVAHYGIVGDLREVIPAMIRLYKTQRQ